MPGRCLFALAALGSVTVAVAVAGVTRAGGSVSRGASGAVTSAWPLSAGPVTSLPGPLVAMTPGDVTNGGEATLLALGTRAIWEVAIGASGMGAVTGTTPLAPGADPVAIACGSRPLDLSDANSPLPCRGSLVFVLDRASEAVLVFEPEPDGSLAQKASLAVGSRPSAFVLADFNDDANDDDIAVANEGSDDVSVVLGRDDGSYAPQQRVPVGARPRDIVAGEYNPEFGSDLAVADSGAGSISFLLGDNHGAFARHDVAVGGSPTALLADSSDDDSLDLDGKGLPDLVVADATAGTVGVLLARRDALPRLASRVSLPGGAASEPVALRQIDGLGGEGNHLLVATRGTGEVLNIPVSDTGALGAASSVLSGAQPVALDVRYALTADVGEDAVVADGSGALRSLLASPSRIVEQRRGAANVAAGGGLVVWSQRVGARHRVRISDRSGVRYLPQSTSRRRLTPRVGRATDGTTVVTYLRCGAHHCTPWVWRVAEGRARRLQIPTARGCSATDLAIWDGVLAFISASSKTGRCRRGERGLWVSARAHRFRISRRATRLGDLRGHRVSWFDGNEILGRLRTSTLHGRPRTVAAWTADDGQAFELGLLSGGFVYWLEPPDRGQERSTLKRASLSARGPGCRVLAPEANFDANSNRPHGRRWVAIDDTQVVHLNDHGVFATAPQPSRWRPCR
jgi:hypothetical protein